MNDPRMDTLRHAVQAMTNGDCSVELPLQGTDEIARLAQAIEAFRETNVSQRRETVTLSRITEQINAGLRLDEILEQAWGALKDFIPYDRIGVALLDEREGQVRARWGRSNLREGLLLGAGYTAKLEGSSLKQIIETGQPRILNDLEAYLKTHPLSESTRLIVQEGLCSSLTCPLIGLGKPIGFIFFSSARPGTYQGIHLDVFSRIANQLSISVERSRLHDQLLELNEIKSRFVGTAAHDLRSPTSIIICYTRLLLDEKVSKTLAEVQKPLERILKNGESMLGLIDDLLDLRAIETGHLTLDMQPVDLEPFLEESLSLLKILGGPKSIAIHWTLESPPGPIRLDRGRIGQVISNLIDNAIKYSPCGSEVTVTNRILDDKVEVSVKDHGQGISPEDAKQLFSEFVRVGSRPTGGEKSHGLGLAICRRIVEAHGGRIFVTSSTGEGSTFTFTLPIGSGPENIAS